jgi:hypothetical protein
VIDELCYVRGCKQQAVPQLNPVFFCDHHLRAARAAKMIVRNSVEWGACLAGCAGFCEKGKWRQAGKFREFVQSNECEHVPAHLLRLALRRA